VEEPKRQQAAEKINIIDYLLVVFKWKKLIVLITLSYTALIAIISLLMPTLYMADTKILPPHEAGTNNQSQLLGQFRGAASQGGVIGAKDTNDLYIGLLRSRAVIDPVIDRFDLLSVYKADKREDVRRILLKKLKTDNDKKSGMIIIGVEDTDPKRSADMSNTFVQELKNLTRGIAVTEASQRRLFFEEQLKDTKVALMRSEEAMKGFQEKTGTVEIKEQAKAIIESVALLRAQIAAKEVEVKVHMTYATPRNPDMQKTETELRGMKEQLSRLESKAGNNPDSLMSTGRLPESGTGYARKLRDLKYNETMFELMAKQYEMAKMDEASDATFIQVVDRAVIPEKKAKPKRLFMVKFALITGFFLSIITAFLIEYIGDAAADPENKKKMGLLKEYSSLRGKN